MESKMRDRAIKLSSLPAAHALPVKWTVSQR